MVNGDLAIAPPKGVGRFVMSKFVMFWKCSKCFTYSWCSIDTWLVHVTLAEILIWGHLESQGSKGDFHQKWGFLLLQITWNSYSCICISFTPFLQAEVWIWVIWGDTDQRSFWLPPFKLKFGFGVMTRIKGHFHSKMLYLFHLHRKNIRFKHVH